MDGRRKTGVEMMILFMHSARFGDVYNNEAEWEMGELRIVDCFRVRIEYSLHDGMCAPEV